MSTVTHESVFREFFARFPATIELSVCAMLLALLIGLPAGVIAAVKRITVWDYPVMGASLTGFSMPIFWWGLLLILTFSVGLGWTPVSGRLAIQYDIAPVTGFMLVDSLLAADKGAFRSALSHLILPSIALDGRHGAGRVRPARRLPARAALRLRAGTLPCRAAGVVRRARCAGAMLLSTDARGGCLSNHMVLEAQALTRPDAA